MIAEHCPPWVAPDLSSIVRRSPHSRGAHLSPSGETKGHREAQEAQYILAIAEATDQQGFDDAVLGQGCMVVNGVSVLSGDLCNVRLGYHQPPFPIRIRRISERTSNIIATAPKSAYASKSFMMSEMGFGEYLFPEIG
jgi:hypothetical protein